MGRVIVEGFIEEVSFDLERAGFGKQKGEHHE